jgi:hypothetical protein
VASPPPPPRPADPNAGAAAAIRRGVQRFLFDAGWVSLAEVTLISGRRVDLLAVDGAGHLLIVEIKSGPPDFRGDRKWPEYLPFADLFAFAVDADFPVELLPDDVGVIVADGWSGEWLRPPATTAPLSAARRKALLIRFATLAGARLLDRPDPPPP